MADVARNEEKAPRKAVYYVENTVRRPGTRFHRAKSATRHRFKQFVAGMQVLRGKKLPLTEEQFRAEEAKLVQMCLDGIVAIHTPDGVKITTAHTGEFILTKRNGAVKILEKGELPTCFGGEGVALVQKAPKPAPKEAVVEEPVVEVVEEEPEEEAAPDDLTALPGIGAGRARKLEGQGITTFASVAEQGVDGLMELLGVTEEVAEEIIAATEEE
jgi:hypothetical protein